MFSFLVVVVPTLSESLVHFIAGIVFSNPEPAEFSTLTPFAGGASVHVSPWVLLSEDRARCVAPMGLISSLSGW